MSVALHLTYCNTYVSIVFYQYKIYTEANVMQPVTKGQVILVVHASSLQHIYKIFPFKLALPTYVVRRISNFMLDLPRLLCMNAVSAAQVSINFTHYQLFRRLCFISCYYPFEFKISEIPKNIIHYIIIMQILVKVLVGNMQIILNITLTYFICKTLLVQLYRGMHFVLCIHARIFHIQPTQMKSVIGNTRTTLFVM